MKAFWGNLFYDVDECGLSKEEMAFKGGDDIRSELRRIEDAIREFDGKKALTLIDELKSYV